MLKMEINRILNRPIFWLLILAGFVLAILPVIQLWPHGVTDDYFVFYPRSPYVSWMYFGSNAYKIYALILPLLASLAYADAYAEDFNSGLIKSILTKVKKRKYLLTRYIINFCVGGIVTILPLIINYLAQMTAFPLIDNNYFFGMDPIGGNAFYPMFFFNNPLLYIALRIIILFFLGGMLASLGLSLSTISKNRYIVLIFPFLVFMGLDVLFVNLIPHYAISDIFLFNAKASWGLPLYLIVGIAGSFIWYFSAGAKNETI